MLRITDARSGELVDAARPRRGLTRVEAHTTGFDITNLRVLLVADTLVRALELGGTPVWALLSGERERAELRAGAAALGIRPFEEGPDAASGLGEARVLHVAADDGRASDGPARGPADGRASGGAAGGSVGGQVPDGPARGPAGGQAADGPARGPVGGQAADGSAQVPAAHASPGGIRVAVGPVEQVAPEAAQEPDPAALRLALLSHPRSAPCRLDPDALHAAHDTLVRWRRAVADWARLPSRPVPDEVRARVRAAWENDLDVPGVLRVLRDVERDPELPDGARFETYAHADRILGIDLARDIGGPA